MQQSNSLSKLQRSMSTTPSKPYKWFLDTMRAAAYWYCSQHCWSRRGKVIERDVQRAIHDYGKPPDGYAVHMEVPYKRFFPNTEVPKPLTSTSELDLAFRRRIKGSRKHTTTIACELKLLLSSRRRLTEDLQRLAAIKSEWPRISTYLAVFSAGHEKDLPKTYQHAIGKYEPIPDTNAQQFALVERFKIETSINDRKYEGNLLIFEVTNIA